MSTANNFTNIEKMTENEISGIINEKFDTSKEKITSLREIMEIINIEKTRSNTLKISKILKSNYVDTIPRSKNIPKEDVRKIHFYCVKKGENKEIENNLSYQEEKYKRQLIIVPLVLNSKDICNIGEKFSTEDNTENIKIKTNFWCSKIGYIDYHIIWTLCTKGYVKHDSGKFLVPCGVGSISEKYFRCEPIEHDRKMINPNILKIMRKHRHSKFRNEEKIFFYTEELENEYASSLFDREYPNIDKDRYSEEENKIQKSEDIPDFETFKNRCFGIEDSEMKHEYDKLVESKILKNMEDKKIENNLKEKEENRLKQQEYLKQKEEKDLEKFREKYEKNRKTENRKKYKNMSKESLRDIIIEKKIRDISECYKILKPEMIDILCDLEI